MKFTCTQENFARALNSISRVASKNVALPILHNVLLSAERGAVKLQSTNLEVAVTATMRAKVEVEGRYTVPSRLLGDFITLLGHEKVEVELQDGGLHIASGHTTTTLKGSPADDFPVLPQPQDTIAIQVPSNILHEAISETLFSAANDESRPEISGLLLKNEGATMTLVATDSYRLSERRIKTLASGGNTTTIMPSRTAQELLRLLPKDETVIEMLFGQSHLLCRWPDAELVSRTIDGQYPDYTQIIPQQWQCRATLPREEFIANIRAASLFCKPGINDITLTIDVQKKELSIAAANTQLGEHQASLGVEVEGENSEVIFNHRYLTEGLVSLTSDTIQVDFGGPSIPTVIRTPGDTTKLYLVMPIRQ